MTLTRRQYAAFLKDDEQTCLRAERVDEAERVARRLARPATNLGSGRGRFWHVLREVEPLLAPHVTLADVGAFPGTTLRLLRRLPSGRDTRLVALGIGMPDPFGSSLAELGIETSEVEFDLRVPLHGASHLLNMNVGDGFDVVVCTEVIEHQMHPASLLLGLNRITRQGGMLVLTTNSVSFVGDIAKLLAGRHSVEALDRSHVLADHAWRPHVRLFTLNEVIELLRLSGFATRRAYYFDNGNVYRGLKGVAVGLVRRTASVIPHLRSHVFVAAERVADPDPRLRIHHETIAAALGLDGLLTT